MIVKSFEISKIKLNNHKFYLFYGDNEGLKEETIKDLFEKNYSNKIHRYEEKEILDNTNNFFNSILKGNKVAYILKTDLRCIKPSLIPKLYYIFGAKLK